MDMNELLDKSEKQGKFTQRLRPFKRQQEYHNKLLAE